MNGTSGSQESGRGTEASPLPAPAVVPDTPAGVLEALSDRLSLHFAELRATRTIRAGAGRPVFILEHGLDSSELETLRSNVRAVLEKGPPSRKWALALLVYAAEVGYRYEGEEYWQTFEATTPGWTRHGDRRWLRERFKEFASAFGGAQPQGAWAGQFTNICWPITHAVLPTDLQLHLARLLYEYRHYQTANLLANPEELGVKLAARAVRSSARFRVFCQNTALLGQVASALLVDAGETPLLLASTLRRIVADLSAERSARRWLADARTSAAKVQLRGLASHIPQTAPAFGRSDVRDPEVRLVAPPKFGLQRNAAGWQLLVEPPDFAPLISRFPELESALSISRCVVAGMTKRPPLPPGYLLYVGLRVELDTWPKANTPLFQLETSDAHHNGLLADECRFSPGPWVFRLGGPASATEVRTKRVRPGHDYIFVTERRIDLLPSWVIPTSLDCAGAYAYTLSLPVEISPKDAEEIARLNLGITTGVEVSPAGLEAAAWDGEGSGEWVIGDEPILALRSTLRASHGLVILDGEAPVRVEWPEGGKGAAYIRFTGLDVGSHMVRVALLLEDRTAPAVEGYLEMVVREPRIRGTGGTFREALLILAGPASPTLEDLWEGRATVDVLGPPGVPVGVEVTLEHAKAQFARKQLGPLTLPISAATWREVFEREFRQMKNVYQAYDGANSCVISITHPELGSVSLSCERAFVPLRWGIGEDRSGYFLRLHDNVGDQTIRVEHFDFDAPDESSPAEVAQDGLYRSQSGGLYVARSTDYVATSILPPSIKDLADLQRMGSHPRFVNRSRTVETLRAWIRVISRWDEAEVPGNPFAAAGKDRVVRAFPQAIAGVVGGGWWEEAERRVEEDQSVERVQLDAALARPGEHSAFRLDLKQLVNRAPRLTIPERIHEFAELSDAVVHAISVDRRWFAEFVLRLASSPGTLEAWAGPDMERALLTVLEAPLILRAARYFILATHYGSAEAEALASYRGWSWE